MLDPTLIPAAQRLDANPEDDGALAQIWTWLADHQRYEQLANVGERIVAARRPSPHTADLCVRIAQLWLESLRRTDRAVAMLSRAVYLDDSHLGALALLSELHLRSGEYKLAEPHVARQLALCGDREKRAELLEQLGLIRERIGDVAGARRALDELVALRPNRPELHRRLGRLHIACARRDAATDDDRRRAARRLGIIAAQAQSDQRALFAEGALALWAGDENAFAVIDTMSQAPMRTARWAAFVASNPNTRMAIRLRKVLAEEYLRSNDPEQAIEVLEPLTGIDVEATPLLETLYRKTDRHAELAGLFAFRERAADTPQQRSLRERIATLRSTGDRQAMLAAMQQLIRLDPLDEPTLSEIEYEYRARGEFAGLRELVKLGAAATTAAPEARASRLFEIASLSDNEIGDTAGAIDALKELVALVPTHAEAVRQLDHLLAREGRWSELLTRLERRAQSADNAVSRRNLWLRFLEVHRHERANPAEEAGVLKRLWSDEPENEALAVALVSARRRAGDMSGVTEVLRTLVDDATPENAANRWRLLGEHLEEVGQVDGALAAWHRVRTLEPEKSSAWEFEERLLAASGSHRVLLETLIAHAAQPAAAGSRTGALYDHAAKLAESLGDRAQATALQREAQRFPHHHDESILSWLDSSTQASPGPDATSASAVSQSDAATPRAEMPTEQFPAASPLDEVVAALDVGDRSAAPDAERDNSDDKTSVFISRPPPDPSIDDDEATTIHVARTNDEPSVEIEIVTEELHAPAPSVVEEPTPRTDVVTRAKDPFEDTGPVLSHANAAQPAPVESPRVFAARPQTPTMASAPVPPPLTPEPTPLPSIIISDDAAETAGDGGFSPESEITPRPDVPLPPVGQASPVTERPGAPERVEGPPRIAPVTPAVAVPLPALRLGAPLSSGPVTSAPAAGTATPANSPFAKLPSSNASQTPTTRAAPTASPPAAIQSNWPSPFGASPFAQRSVPAPSRVVFQRPMAAMFDQLRGRR